MGGRGLIIGSTRVKRASQVVPSCKWGIERRLCDSGAQANEAVLACHRGIEIRLCELYAQTKETIPLRLRDIETSISVLTTYPPPFFSH